MLHTANLTNHDPSAYAQNASFVYSDANTAPVLKLLQASPGERIADIGCGSGELTWKLQQLVGQKGQVWGIDSNEKMLDKARKAYPDLAARLFQSDAQAMHIPAEMNDQLVHSFDAVFTNATLHWCKSNPRGVLEGVKLLLKQSMEGASTPRPRFVGEFGGFMNCSAIRSALHQVVRERGHDPEDMDPWYFPTPAEYQSLLESAGFQVDHISLTPRISQLPTDLYGWLITFARNSFLASYSDDDADSIMREVVKRCEVDCLEDSARSHKAGHTHKPAASQVGKWAVMYVRLRFVATL